MLDKFKIFNYTITGTQINEFIDHVLNDRSRTDGSRTAKMTVLANTHVLTTGRLDPSYDAVLMGADYLLPDGMPLIWIGRLKGRVLRSRVYGPGLIHAFLDQTQNKPFSHYFYGGRPEGQDRMIAEIRKRYPGTKIAGHESPPFRPLTAEEDAAAVERINASGADFVWVGLGCPKQEIWMRNHRSRIKARMMFGVGQAFDILAGITKQAPLWMGNAGLEWFYRLCSKPTWLWKRYLVYAPLFVILFLGDECRRWIFRTTGLGSEK